MWYSTLILSSSFYLLTLPLWAEEKGGVQPATEGEKKVVKGEGKEEKEKCSKTTHTITIGGKKLHYSAVAGEIFLSREKDGAKGRLCYVAYELENKQKRERPLSFVFNGGPGAASVWLHLGGLGPKRIVLTDEGRALPPPVRYRENPLTWLAFTDLVFVDPIGTGFSRSIPDDEQTRKKFFGVQQDIESVAQFIRVYLTRSNRWTSPQFLIGESYGTTRVSGLTGYLHQRYGIALNGVILISPVLDFDTVSFHPSNDLPYLLFFPTYAATAWYHGLLPSTLQQKQLTQLLDEVEAFCITTYTVALAKGENLLEEERKKLLHEMNNYTSLPEDLISHYNFRISWSEFTKNLLKDKGQIVGRMDTTMVGIEPNPSQLQPTYDPALDRLFGPFSSAMNAYVREELKFESDVAYEFLNEEVNRAWDWSTGLTKEQGFIDVSHTLREAIAVNENLKVFIASGCYDLATPYCAAKHTVNHMWLGEQRPQVMVKLYQAGHMIFTHREALQKLFKDVEDFYKGAVRN